MRKNTYHHGNLKETLLDISFDFIEKNDIDKLTLKILSEITGTSRSAIYSHFSSKDALIEAMILDGFKRFDLYLSPLLNAKDVLFVTKLRQASRAYIEFARSNKVLYRLLFGSKYAHIRMDIMTKNDPDRSGFGSLLLAIEAAQKDGNVKPGDPYRLTITVWAMLHGLASLLIDGFIGMEAMQDALFEEVFSGIVLTLGSSDTSDRRSDDMA